MNFKDLVRTTRSYRRFYEEVPVSREDLVELVSLARVTASAANNQPLRYKLAVGPEDCAKVFATLSWAGALKDWDGPEAGERPTGYIVLLSKKDINSAWDEGIVAQTILLGAVDKGFGGCMFASVNRDVLAKSLSVPEEYAIKLVIALGKPKEHVVIDDVHIGDSLKYYREPDQTHHVPKLVLDDLIL